MSIPPLVCSTPPPPDQCEDDKDPGDFDIQYSLSQDDDDDNYDFGGFSTYNHYQFSQSKTDPATHKALVRSEKSFDSSKEHTDIIENVKTDTTAESKLKFEEDTNIEDLHLEDLKVDQDAIESIIETNIEENTNDPNTKGVQEMQIPESLTDSASPDDSQASPIQLDEFIIEPSSVDQIGEPPSYVDEIIAAVDDMQITPTEIELPLEIAENDDPIQVPKILEFNEQEIPILSDPVVEPKPEEDLEDDFGDFDDIQFASSGDKPTIVDSCDNPWDKNDNAIDNDFGDFKANFDDNNESNTVNTLFEKAVHSTEVMFEDKADESSSALTCDVAIPTDDDFGDFNDFQSSSAELQPSTESEEVFDYPLLDLKKPIDKLMDTVNSVIFSIFEDEILEPVEDIEGSLDAELGVTWGHLLQTDERQPYMVNWNSSLGQKTLLKALCIDSRNILFGPKWSYNMPKYAATLSAAPLQPQKQNSSPSTPQVETINPEKSTNKPAGTWTDPFTSDGQESCNPDAPTENPVIETGPTDLDVFEASTSSKPDKIFSSTLNVQPLRQISLPDTHIFTPTDSETPRSTTIHYDNRPPVLLPQTIIETSNSEPSFKSEPQTLPSKASATNNDEYWEFQDFKGSSNPAPSSAKNDTSKDNLNISYATQVLQPVKVEPIIPKLNWPDPGEVKEVFDDFSDFISSSSLSNTLQITPIVPVQKIDSKPTNEPDNAGPSKTIAISKPVANDTSGDDDFDTFQSAQPSSRSVDFNCTSVSNVSNAVGAITTISPQAPPQTISDFNFAFQKAEKVKPNTISIENVIKPKDSFVQNSIPSFPSNLEVKIPPLHASSSSGMNTGLLQPTPASTSGSIPSQQQKSAQILQPLSLESFSQINWPNPGIDLQDLSRFNPVETLHSLKSDLSVNSQSKVASPVHIQKSQKPAVCNQSADDDWGEFVSSKPKPQQPTMPKKQTTFADDDEWTDFVSSPSVKPQNGLNTISLNVHTNFQSKPSNFSKGSKVPIEIPSLNYITPKSSHKTYNDRHFQNL